VSKASGFRRWASLPATLVGSGILVGLLTAAPAQATGLSGIPHLRGVQVIRTITIGQRVPLGQAIADVKRRVAAIRATALGPDDAVCITNATIFSLANNLYVSAELGYSGGNYAMLRARASVVGPWERYNLCNFVNTANWFIVSQANGLAVSAELGYSGGSYAMLRARASAVGPWEQFAVRDNGDGSVSLLSLANGLWVSAELGYSGGNYAMLRARASAIGPWERFAK